MKILLLPDSFKGSLSSARAANILETAAREVFPDAEIEAFPIADGGEGTLEAMKKACGGALVPVEVTGPCGVPVRARYLSIGNSAVIELAEAAGLALRMPGFSPMRTTTFGVGQLIANALEVGHRHIVIGLGGSATTDCGCGLAAALGTQFLDPTGRPFVPTGESLTAIRSIRLNGFFFRQNSPRIEALCDVSNPLYGPQGAAEVFGPQKGASPDEVKRLDEGLRHVADLFKKSKVNLNAVKGGGAAGGAGAGVAAFLNGRLVSGIDAVLDLMKFEEKAKTADLIVTGEGCVDGQTLSGKVAAGIARRAGGTPVAVLAGSSLVTPDEMEKLRALGITAVFPVLRRPCELSEAMSEAPQNLQAAALNLFHMMRAMRS
ncbi:glycerate kinase [Sutterella sp.]|uniref:glycerate kinase family protein n=1 Tax=Sutterella sp. TaxID=1981025 RepID=UPI0026E0B4ED|nr:glycerate kinase [Sutterella sp.]MDO5532783.1 glycerate kinase [Sutterella sp.]